LVLFAVVFIVFQRYHLEANAAHIHFIVVNHLPISRETGMSAVTRTPQPVHRQISFDPSELLYHWSWIDVPSLSYGCVVRTEKRSGTNSVLVGSTGGL